MAYDNRLLVKVTPSSAKILQNAPKELPYEGTKEMLLVEDIENRELLKTRLESMYEELPEPKKKK